MTYFVAGFICSKFSFLNVFSTGRTIPCGTSCSDIKACSNARESCSGATCQYPTGLDACNGQCLNTNTDDHSCGKSCTDCTLTGEECNYGQCQCPAGQTMCLYQNSTHTTKFSQQQYYLYTKSVIICVKYEPL
jgi:hypothetical protein